MNGRKCILNFASDLQNNKLYYTNFCYILVLFPREKKSFQFQLLLKFQVMHATNLKLSKHFLKYM